MFLPKPIGQIKPKSDIRTPSDLWSGKWGGSPTILRLQKKRNKKGRRKKERKEKKKEKKKERNEADKGVAR